MDPSKLDPIYIWLVIMLAAAGGTHISLSVAAKIGDPLDFCNNQDVEPSSNSDVDPERLDPVLCSISYSPRQQQGTQAY